MVGLLSAMLLTSCLAAESCNSANRPPVFSFDRPSYLDYVALASMADSPHLLRMAAYHPTRAEDPTVSRRRP